MQRLAALTLLFAGIALATKPQLYYISNASEEAIAALSEPREGFALLERTSAGALLVRSSVPPKLLFPQLLGLEVEHFRKSAHARHPKRRKEGKARRPWKLGAAEPKAAHRSFRVLLYEDLDASELERWRSNTACEIKPHGERGLLFERCTRPERTLAALEKLPEVRHVEEWHPPRRAEAYANWIVQSNSESCAPTSGCTPLWDEGLNGAGQILGMGDGGMNQRYCQLSDDACSASTDAEPPACGGDYYSPPCGSCVPYSLRPNDPTSVPADDGNPIVRAYRPFADYSDCDGHGTATSSLALGRPPVSFGNASSFEAYVMRGVAYGARVAFTDIGPGCSPYYDVPVPLDTAYYPWSYAVGARVHSDSWGSSSDGSYSSLSQDIDAFCWYHRDFLPVFAAGNEGESDGLGSITTQGSAKNALTVGATMNSYDATLRFPSFVSAYNVKAYPGRFTQDWVAAFSSFGPTSDGRIKPDVVAPGTCITVANAARAELSGKREPNCAYPGVFQGEAGTSFSTPIVAASIVLLRQWLQELGRANPPASLLKALVINSAVDTSGINVFDRSQVITAASLNADRQLAPFGYRYIQGFGRVDLVNYSSSALSRLYLAPSFPAFTAAGQHVDLCVSVNSSSHARTPISITMVYTDFPAALRDVAQLVNDLDLAVVDSSCARYYPNGLVGHTDSINNVEKVVATISVATPLFVRVKASRLLVTPQDFSLVASVGDASYSLHVSPCSQASTVCAAQLGSNPLPMESSGATALSSALLFTALLLLCG